MSFTFIDDATRAAKLPGELAAHERIALDCEAAGFHRYSDQLCLVQVSTPTADYVLDALSIDVSEVLRPSLEAPDVEVVVHGADYDIRLLDRDLGLRPRGLFDTQAAAALLGEPSLGLAALLEAHLGVRVSKKYQRADWAQRPLSPEMLEYAASDTRHLFGLADLLHGRLEALGRSGWAQEEFRLLEAIRWEEPDEDPIARFRGARDLTLREVAALREAIGWRDRLARVRDRAPFRVTGDAQLLEIVRSKPRSLDELARVAGMNANLARTEGAQLLERLAWIHDAPVSDLAPFPARKTNGRGRPPPEVETLADRLKEARNRRAVALGIDRGTLMPNSVLAEMAWVHPRTMEELEAIKGIRKWQAGAAGRELLAVLKPSGSRDS